MKRKRRKIKNLSETGHPIECARILLLEYVGTDPSVKKNNKIKDGHKLHLYVNGNEVNITVNEGNKTIKMYIPLDIALKQAEEFLKVKKKL